MDIEKLKKAGIDYEKGIERFLDDRQLYEKVLSAFLADNNLRRAQDAFDKQDYHELYERIHELKGSSGNAEMTCLYVACCHLTELLRSEACSRNQLEKPYKDFINAYMLTKECIKLALEV